MISGSQTKTSPFKFHQFERRKIAITKELSLSLSIFYDEFVVNMNCVLLMAG